MISETKIKLIPDIVVSDPSELTLNYIINGVNAPLIF